MRASIPVCVTEVCRAAYRAEISGKYESGLNLIIPYWNYKQPEMSVVKENLSDRETSEIFLRAGALYGFFGFSQPIFQETSKDLLTEALTCYQALDDEAKQAECCNYLALAYWRMGNLEESDAWLSLSLHRKKTDETFLHTLIVESLVNLTKGENLPVIGKFIDYRDLFLKSENLFLKGVFFMNFALAKKNIGESHETIKDFEKAADLFARLDNKPYFSMAQNNIARYFQNCKMFDKAMEYAQKAQSIALETGDLQKIGGIYDTQAQISLDLNSPLMAEYYAAKSIEVLSKTEAYGYLIESYETLLQCQLMLGKCSEALITYHQAMTVAADKCGKSVVERLTAAAAAAFKRSRSIKLYREGGALHFHEYYELVLPDGFFSAHEITAIESASTRLEHIGIRAGDLIVVEQCDVVSGDFIALNTKTNVSYCGIVDFVGERVILKFEAGAKRRLNFSIRDVQIVGKVIGHCRVENEYVNVLKVNPISDFEFQ